MQMGLWSAFGNRSMELHIQMLASRWLGSSYKKPLRGFPGGTVVESLPANAGDAGSSPGLGRSHMPRSN